MKANAGPVHFDLSEAYMTKLLAMICRTPQFLFAHRDLISPEYFPNAIMADICRCALQYFDTYNSTPTVDALDQAILDLLKTDKKRKPMAAGYAEMLDAISTCEIAEEEDITARVVQFVRKQSMRSALIQCSKDFDRNSDFSVIEERITQAMLVGSSKLDMGSDYFDAPLRFNVSRRDSTIPTGIRTVDKNLNGGIAPGELGLLLATTGKFKTGTMINFAYGALYYGCDVVFISFEQNETDILARFDKRFLRMLPKAAAPSVMQARVDELKKRLKRNLRIKYWPMLSAGVAELRAYLYQLQGQGIIDPKNRRLVLFVDYGQIMKSACNYAEIRHNQRDNYQRLIQLAVEFGCPVWSALQAPETVENKAILGNMDVSESKGIIRDAHIVISLNADVGEKQRYEVRLHHNKTREARSFGTVNCLIDPLYMTLYDVTGWSPTEIAETRKSIELENNTRMELPEPVRAEESND